MRKGAFQPPRYARFRQNSRGLSRDALSANNPIEVASKALIMGLWGKLLQFLSFLLAITLLVSCLSHRFFENGTSAVLHRS